MASFQELQGQNLRASLLLMLVVSAITLSGGLVLGFLFGGDDPSAPFIGLGLAAVFALIHMAIAWSSGADLVLSMHHAQEIGPDDAQWRKVYNVVEEMRIAAGLPMPRVYIISDPSPNAFATGRDPEDGRVAVTTGLIETLNREELQGVIAHELAHIKNRDILYATIVVVMVGVVAMIASVMRHMLWHGAGRNRARGKGGGQAQAVIFILALAFMILAPIFVQLVRLAISRQREYLADATGAKFTRNPGGLANALVKISGQRIPFAAGNKGASHMYIADPYAQTAAFSAGELMSTHPPVEKRIERLMQLGRGGLDPTET